VEPVQVLMSLSQVATHSPDGLPTLSTSLTQSWQPLVCVTGQVQVDDGLLLTMLVQTPSQQNWLPGQSLADRHIVAPTMQAPPTQLCPGGHWMPHGGVPLSNENSDPGKQKVSQPVIGVCVGVDADAVTAAEARIARKAAGAAANNGNMNRN